MNKFFLFSTLLILLHTPNAFAVNNFSFSDISSDDFFGYDIESIGDLNEDGITDIAVGAPHRYYFDTELSPVHILLLDNDGKVKSFETIPHENNIMNNSNIFYFLGITVLLITLAIIIKIKLKNNESKIRKK